ncbi:MAG: 2-oxo acid dehydrogenase subunit E2 [Hyphomicrobiales bacterium]|nr:2-oxo acid dehydrogenase subunit E2 [Hyphomicrobiales bacterium]
MSDPSPTQAQSLGGVPLREVRPLGPMQRMAAAHLARRHAETAAVTLFGEAEADGLVALKARLDGVTYTALVLKAVAQTLRRHPHLNAALEDDAAQVYDEINIGLALALADGNLVVPVLRRADTRPVAEVAAWIAAAEDRPGGKFTRDELSGGTFTLTNAGMIPSTRFTTPIIPARQAAILGLGALRRAPVVRDGQVTAGWLLPTSLTFDHRLLNGVPASRFVDDLHGLLARPDDIDLGL